jgi:hypothetical protein
MKNIDLDDKDHKLMNHGMGMTDLHHGTFINTKMDIARFCVHKQWWVTWEPRGDDEQQTSNCA